MHKDLPFVLEEMRDGERFASTATAIVENKLSRADVCTEGSQLRPLVLDFEASPFKFLSL